MPFWITLGFYAFILLSSLIALIKGDFQFRFEMFNGVDFSSIPASVIFFANYSVTLMPGFMMIIFAIMISQNAINEDFRRNFELFHRSQPVSIWLRSLSKFMVGTLGSWFVLLIIVAVNFIIINIIMAFFLNFDFGLALVAVLQALIKFLILTLFIGSIAFFCSAIFKDKAFLKGLALLIAIHVFFLIVNLWFGWHLPSPITYLVKLFHFSSQQQFAMHNADFDIYGFVRQNWNRILFNWKVLLQIVSGGILFASATLIYKNKEVK